MWCCDSHGLSLMMEFMRDPAYLHLLMKHDDDVRKRMTVSDAASESGSS
jgi:hypothetical protein